MAGRKINYIYKVLVALAIVTFSFIPLKIYAEESEETVKIEICPDTLINEHFYGFGAETLPWLWTKENREAGVNEEDIKLNVERIKDMHLPITRIFVPWETWNPSVDYKTFTWGSDEMKSLYKTLDLYQETGTKVILVTVDWLKESPWNNPQASAQAVLRLLEYLIKDKGYSCIQFWTLTNEPELTYDWLKKLPFDNYIQIHRLVKEGLRERKLPIKIIGSDEVESQDWFEKSVQSLYGVADIFSSHRYLYPQQIDSIADYFRERLNIISGISSAKEKIPFFLCEFGFRGSDFSASTNNLMEDYEYGLYVANLCVEALNSGVDSASLWCLHRIRLIDEINPEGGKMMRIGLWAYKDENWQPFPIFYLYQLFTRYIRSGSRVLGVSINDPNILKVACIEYRGSYSLFIVNLTDKEQVFLIKGINPEKDFKKYLYNNNSKSKFSLGQDSPFIMENQIRFDNSLEDRIPPISVILYTDLQDEDYTSREFIGRERVTLATKECLVYWN